MSEQTQDNKSLFNMVVAVLLTVLLVGVMVVPIINTATQTTTTTSIDNEGAGWLKLGYNSGKDFDFEITNEDSNIIIGDQTGTMGDNIFYADSKNVIFADSLQNAIFLLDTDSSSVHKFSGTVSVENTGGTLNISDGTETVVSSGSPTWAYIPDPTGTYGFFTNGGLTLEDGKPTVAVGSYAGVFAYNNTVIAFDNLGSLGLVKSGDYADGVVTWAVPDPESTYGSDSAIGLNAGNNIILRSADPTNGTRVGDLYYTFSGDTATIVGYSSEIDWSTFTDFPDTVTNDGNTYTITKIGGRAFQNCASLNVASLPEGLVEIGTYAFNGCTSLALTSLPAGLHTIAGYNAFNGCTSLALTSLPEGVTNIGSGNCFSGCTSLALTSLPEGLTTLPYSAFSNTGITNIYIPEGTTTIGETAFTNCSELENVIIGGSPVIGNNCFKDSGVKEVLNLGQTEITTTSYGLNADSVQDHVTALGYIAPVSIHNTITETDGSVTATLMQFLPVILVLALIVLVGTAIMIPRAGLGRYMDR